MSNRDKFLLVVIGIAGVILLPYFLYIKDTRDRITNLDNEIVALEARYQELLEYEKNREMYEKGIVEYTEKRDEIIAKYPEDIQQASQIMYLLNTEYGNSIESSSMDIEGHEEDEYEIVTVEPAVRFDEGSFQANTETRISSMYMADQSAEEGKVSEIVETDYVALQNVSKLSFSCYDQNAVNYLLQHIRDDEDYPMIYRSINFKFNMETGRVSGDMELYQYAVTGPDREFDPIPVKPEITDDIRGNEDYGIFGPWTSRIWEEMKAEAETETTDEAETEEN